MKKKRPQNKNSITKVRIIILAATDYNFPAYWNKYIIMYENTFFVFPKHICALKHNIIIQQVSYLFLDEKWRRWFVVVRSLLLVAFPHIILQPALFIAYGNSRSMHHILHSLNQILSCYIINFNFLFDMFQQHSQTTPWWWHFRIGVISMLSV